MSKQIKMIAINSFSGYAKFAMNLALLFFLTPFIITHIGKDQFGLWSLILSILGFFELLDLGLGTTVVKLAAECRALKETQKRNRLITTIFLVYLGLGIAGMVGVGMLLLSFNLIFDLPAAQLATGEFLLLLLAFKSLLIAMPFSVFRGLLVGEQKIAAVNTISAISLIIYATLAVFWLLSGYGVIALGVANLVGAVIEFAAYALWAKKIDPHLGFSKWINDRNELKTIFSISSAQFASNLGTLALHNSDIVVIKFFLPLSAVAIYAIPLRIATYGYILVKQFTNVLTPTIVDKHTLLETEKVKEIFLRGGKYAFLAASALTIPGCLYATDFITFWIGSDFASGGHVLRILLLAFWLTTPQILAGDILFMTGFHRLVTVYSLIMVGVHISTSLILIHPFGLLGVAFGSIAGAIAGYATEFRRACLNYSVSFRELWQNFIQPIALPILAQGSFLVIVNALIPPTSILSIILVNLPALILFLGATWLTSLDEKDKHYVRTSLNKAEVT